MKKDLDERIKKIEKKVEVPDFKQGSTKIAWECLTWREQRLFNKIEEMTKKYGADLDKIPEDLQMEVPELSIKGLEILSRRAFDLFQTIINGIYLGEDWLNQWIFWSRFFAFWNTTMNIIKMRRIEDKHYMKFEEQYGEDWPDNLPEPDYSGIGEKDFNKELKNQFKRHINTRNSR